MAKLIFRYSTMNSGKTTNLLQVAHNYEERGFIVKIAKSEIDTKAEDRVSSRIGLKRKVDYLLPPQKNISIDLKINVLLIDEAQFLNKEQIDQLYEISKLYNILIICYGLRTDFRMQGFEGASRLLEIADEIEELKSICSCGKKATFNIRLFNGKPVFEGEQISIDNQEKIKYDTVCGECFLKLQKGKKDYHD